jgi:hypothetical protein
MTALTVNWGPSDSTLCYYDIVYLPECLITNSSFTSIEELEESRCKEDIMQITSLQDKRHYWGLVLKGKPVGMDITLEEYIANHYPEILL